MFSFHKDSWLCAIACLLFSSKKTGVPRRTGRKAMLVTGGSSQEACSGGRLLFSALYAAF